MFGLMLLQAQASTDHVEPVSWEVTGEGWLVTVSLVGGCCSSPVGVGDGGHAGAGGSDDGCSD